MNKEAVDQAMDKAVDLIKNNDLRNKIFKGCERVYLNNDQHKNLLFLKQDFSKNRNSCFDLFDKYYKLTTYVSGDGHCGVRSAALAMGLRKEDKDLTEQDIINLRKEFREIAAERKCDGQKGLDQFESNNWVYDGPLAAVTNVKGNKPCLVVSKKDGDFNLFFSNDGNIKRIAESSYHLEDFMNETPDDMMVILLNENHFQPLDIKKINSLEFITKLIKAEFLFKTFWFLDPGVYSTNSNSLPLFGGLKGMVYALFKQQEAKLIIKNIREILNATPESDKLSVLLAIAEELCQEFNARIEKFKANELDFGKNNSNAEPPKTEEEKNKTDTHEQKNNSYQTNDTKTKKLENKTEEKNKTNESGCDNQEEKNKSDQETIKKLDTLLEKTQTFEEFDKDVHKLYEQNNQASVILDKADKKTHSVFNENKSSSVFYKIGENNEARQKELVKLKKYFIICIIFSNMPYKDKKDMIAKVKNADKASVFSYILNVLKNFFTGKIAAAFSSKIIQSLKTLSELEKKILSSQKKLSEIQKSDNQREK